MRTKAAPRDAFSIAETLANRGRHRDAFRVMLTAARRGNSSVFLNLGVSYDCGRGVRQSEANALLWYRRALHSGDHASAAATNIATVYRDRGNRRRAFFWWNRAAAFGDGDALVDVGYCLQYGLGVRRNLRLAAQAFCSAKRSRFTSAWGWEEAYYHLAILQLDRSDSAAARRLTADLLANASADGDYPEAAAALESLCADRPVEPCRCRRGLSVKSLGHTFCGLHS